jgi:predicted nucleotidyltransferase
MLIERIARALKEHKVQFAVAGGWAVALHGAVRGTIDVDLVVVLTQKNLVLAEEALQSIGLHPRQPVNARDVYQFREEYIKNRNMIAWSFINKNNPAEIVDIILPEDLSILKAIQKQIGSTRVPVLSKTDLIRMKRKSGRPQDLEDIKALQELG